MVITNAQNASFFTNGDQMAIPQATCVHLANEGLATIDGLKEFTDQQLKDIAANFCCHPDGPVILGAKSLRRLTVACHDVKFYESVGQAVRATNVQWNNNLKDFKL